ncbi:HAD family hydrolase [Neolewinella agarilytica]|uniref:Phosphoglycolate phosphatase, HAD superfamily n=1 Tax=Neolewinella agarilytica TaxID=478744 RepID=A0A1H9H9B5_9BACT|nr:HAD family hydrolase [Neolewinella agarilytica]SEQ58827.1 Phosphoglycolate phosphatase, HAD superfamily [Neolewinella agarilytica]
MSELLKIGVQPGDVVVFDIDKTVSDTHVLELLLFLRERELSPLGYRLWLLYMYGFWGPVLKVLDWWSRPRMQRLVYSWYARYTDEALRNWSSTLFAERLLGKCYPAVVEWLEALQAEGAEIFFVSTNIAPVVVAYSDHFGGFGKGVELGALFRRSRKGQVRHLADFKQNSINEMNKNIALAVGDSTYDLPMLKVAAKGVVIGQARQLWMGAFRVFNRLGQEVEHLGAAAGARES